MRRACALAALLSALCAGAASADTFTVVPGEAPLPSFEIPNPTGGVVFPADLSTPPATPVVLSYDELLTLWQQAGAAYGIPWELLAAINQIESNFGGNMGPSWAGAVGWMQFMPSTWERWGLDANGDGIADPWNPTDAVYAAARYLAATGAHEDLPGAVWSYNHSQEYVDDVLALAAEFLMNPLRGRALLGVPTGVTDNDFASLEQQLAEAQLDSEELASSAASIQAGMADSEQALLEAGLETGDARLSAQEFQAAQDEVAGLEAGVSLLQQELARVQGELGASLVEVAALEEAFAIEQSPFATNGLEGLFGKPPTPQAAGVIDYAMRQLGIPYVWGGNHGVGLEDMIAREPSLAGGFDCSSLLAWSFAKGAGIYIGDWTGTQWEQGATLPGVTRGIGPAQEGGATPPGGYLPGDLVFFNLTGHVGMYLGNDMFIHAPHTGDVVRVERLSNYSLQVWGWVRYAEVSGQIFGSEPEGSRVFSIVEPAEPKPAADQVITFSRS
jgi:cell wall-associated NlpC family hydrolase